ncbi:MAG: signal peptidase I [Acidobacteria bacterium]|nr:signal peptidase I [Acidobacteriota bacterium]
MPEKPVFTRRTHRLLLLAVVVAAVGLTGTVRVYRVAGISDAPMVLHGDLILVNHAAYGLPVPFTQRHLFRWSTPQLGEYVFFRAPDRAVFLCKCVLGLPGDQVEVRGGRVWRNGQPLHYEDRPMEDFRWISRQHRLGEDIVRESESDWDHEVNLLDPQIGYETFGPISVPAEHVFLLGSNRPHSRDSRHFGPVPLTVIAGRVLVNLSALRR